MTKIYAPNERYTGLIAGVSFSNGEAETNDAWLISWFENKGYEIAEEENIPFVVIPEIQHPLTEEEIAKDFIEDVEKAIEIYGEEVVFDHKTPAIDEEVNLEPTIEPTESELNLEELTVKGLIEIALDKGIEVPKKIKKAELIELIREG